MSRIHEIIPNLIDKLFNRVRIIAINGNYACECRWVNFFKINTNPQYVKIVPSSRYKRNIKSNWPPEQADSIETTYVYCKKGYNKDQIDVILYNLKREGEANNKIKNYKWLYLLAQWNNEYLNKSDVLDLNDPNVIIGLGMEPVIPINKAEKNLTGEITVIKKEEVGVDTEIENLNRRNMDF